MKRKRCDDEERLPKRARNPIPEWVFGAWCWCWLVCLGVLRERRRRKRRKSGRFEPPLSLSRVYSPAHLLNSACVCSALRPERARGSFVVLLVLRAPPLLSLLLSLPRSSVLVSVYLPLLDSRLLVSSMYPPASPSCSSPSSEEEWTASATPSSSTPSPPSTPVLLPPHHHHHNSSSTCNSAVHLRFIQETYVSPSLPLPLCVVAVMV